MKQETERLSDVERNKELFEYEMTEVILQLKGEFAKLSGKDLHLEAEQFALKPLNLPAAMPEVTIDPVQIAVDSVPVFETLSAMPEIAMHDSKIDCPDVSALNPIVIQPIAMHFSELDYPSVPDISTCHPFEISMGMPEISYDTPSKMTMLKMPDVKIAPTAIPAVSYDLKNGSVKIPDITMQQVAISFDFPSISISKEQPVVALEKPTLDIPQTTIQLPKLEEIAIEKVSVEVLSVKKFALPSVTPVVDFQPAAIDLPGETIPQFQTNFKVTAHPEPMEKMAVPQMTMPEQAHVALQLPEMTIPEISTCNISLQPISIQKSEIPVPEVHTNTFEHLNECLKSAAQADSSLQPFSIPYDEISVPKITIHPPEKIESSVKKTDFHIDYPTMHSISIPPVTLSNPEHIAVPESPDFQTAIQGIMESIV